MFDIVKFHEHVQYALMQFFGYKETAVKSSMWQKAHLFSFGDLEI